MNDTVKDTVKEFLISMLELAEIMAELGEPGADDQVQGLKQLLKQDDKENGNGRPTNT